MEVSDHHCNRLDPCSKQSPFLFELPLVFGFPSSRILGCDQYYCLNWKQEMLSVDCCMAGVFTGLYQNSFTLVCQVVLYLYCCLFCIMQVGGVKPIWGITEGEEKCTAPWAKWDWNRSLCDRCPVLKISLGSTRESGCQPIIQEQQLSCFCLILRAVFIRCSADALRAASPMLELSAHQLCLTLCPSSCADPGSGWGSAGLCIMVPSGIA